MKYYFRNETVLIADSRADGNGNIYDIAKVSIPEHPVPVTYNFNSDMVVGKAELRIVGNEVRANFEIETDLLEATIEKLLVPCIGGIATASETKPDGEEQTIEINTIGLSKANVDDRIKPLLCDINKI
jgi:hypothetical protein